MRGKVEELALRLLQGRQPLRYASAVERRRDIRRIAAQAAELISAEERRVRARDHHHRARAIVERQGEDDRVLSAGALRRQQAWLSLWVDLAGQPVRRLWGHSIQREDLAAPVD